MEYEFEETHSVRIGALLDNHAHGASDTTEIWTRSWSDADYGSLADPVRLEFDFLFGVELQEDFTTAGSVALEESNVRATATRPFAATPEAAWLLREALLSSVSDHMVRAHLADLILSGRRDASPAHAEATVEHYRTCARDDGLEPGRRAISLARANTIARSRRMTTEASVREQALKLAREMLTLGHSHAALTLFALLSVPARDGSTASSERIEVRESLRGIAATAPEFIDEIVRLLHLAAESEEDQTAAARLHISWYLDNARGETNGLRKVYFGYEAMQLAERYAQFDLRDDAAVFLQAAGEDVELQTFEHDLPISRNHLRRHLRKYRHARDWRDAYRVFLAGAAPTGDHARNVTEAETGRQGLLSLASNISLGPLNLPTRTGASAEEEQLHRIEGSNIGTMASILALELEHIDSRFDSPSREEFANWFAGIFACDPVLSEQLADAQKRHWERDFTGASLVCLPLIEAAARVLLLKLDEPLYRAERGASPGRFPALDFYVQALEDNGLDVDWVRTLRATLLSDGLNIRNLSAHGFKSRFNEGESALLVRLAGFACALAGTIDHAELSKPLVPVRAGLRRRIGWIWS